MGFNSTVALVCSPTSHFLRVIEQCTQVAIVSEEASKTVRGNNLSGINENGISGDTFPLAAGIADGGGGQLSPRRMFL